MLRSPSAASGNPRLPLARHITVRFPQNSSPGMSLRANPAAMSASLKIFPSSPLRPGRFTPHRFPAAREKSVCSPSHRKLRASSSSYRRHANRAWANNSARSKFGMPQVHGVQRRAPRNSPSLASRRPWVCIHKSAFRNSLSQLRSLRSADTSSLRSCMKRVQDSPALNTSSAANSRAKSASTISRPSIFARHIRAPQLRAVSARIGAN